MREYKTLFTGFSLMKYALMCSALFLPLYALDEVQIGFVGDIMLGRALNEQIASSSYAYPWGDIAPLLKGTALAIGNLETALTTSTKRVPKAFNFKADPDKVKTLKEGPITVANLANNHSLDFSVEGMKETIKTLNAAKISHVGAGNNLTEAQQPVIIAKNGMKIGFIGATDNEPTWVATQEKPGTNYVNIEKGESLLKLIKRVKPTVDILILSIHWGPNMREYPTKEYRAYAHQLIDAGVDIIHGHSAHILQPIEIYKGKVIMYDTGDIIDDYAVNKELRNDRSALFLITIDKHSIKKLVIVPVLINAMQATRAPAKETEAIMEMFKKKRTCTLKRSARTSTFLMTDIQPQKGKGTFCFKLV